MSVTLTISRLRNATDRIRVLSLVPASGAPLPGWDAGAHVRVDLGAAGSRAYSLIRWPGEDAAVWHIAVQREDMGDGGSRAMHALSPGDPVRAEGPKNDFALGDHAGPALLIAGGIGITPLISMATDLAAAGRDFRLVFAARNRAAMAFGDQLSQVFGDRVRLAFDDEDPLDLAGLLTGIDPATHLYICGPRGMIEAARDAAERAGFPAAQVHVELFTNPAPQDGDRPFEVEIASTGAVFTVPPGQSIIEVLEDGGVDLVYDCQRGDCGICQTDVISGTPDHRDVVLSEAERAAGKVMQICVSRAKSDRLVLDL